LRHFGHQDHGQQRAHPRQRGSLRELAHAHDPGVPFGLDVQDAVDGDGFDWVYDNENDCQCLYCCWLELLVSSLHLYSEFCYQRHNILHHLNLLQRRLL
jgi:hypothetical protein